MARVILLVLILFLAACRPGEHEERTVRFTIPADGFASIHIKNANGIVVRHLGFAQTLSKGAQRILWDGLDDERKPVPSGEYAWSGAFHTGVHAKLRGRAAMDFAGDWLTSDASAKYSDTGAPSAIAADAERVFIGWRGQPVLMGWTESRSSGLVLACDLDGRVLWRWWLDEARTNYSSAIKALSVDAGIVTVLQEPLPNATADTLVKLDSRTGAVIPWPGNRSLTISSLWPADAKVNPQSADGMAVRAGRIYLTFTAAQFLAVLDAQTGAYLQTVVGAPPELIDAVPTKTESPDKPGELMDADFALISLRGGVLGKVLFAHDPLWVVTSDLQPLDREERITALSVIGDGAKHHQHSVFVALGLPFQQVQRRAILNTEGFLWSAGRAGGRRNGPWIPEALGPICGLALDAHGRLWVAEGEATPPRVSVWATDGTEGRLVRDFFGRVPRDAYGTAILPTDPNIFVGAGCEWRLDPQTGTARCTGVIWRDTMKRARFRLTPDGKTELLVMHRDGQISVFERVGEGNYEPRPPQSTETLRGQTSVGTPLNEFSKTEVLLPGGTKLQITSSGFGIRIGTADGLPVARLFQDVDATATDLSASKELAPGTDLSDRFFGGFPAVVQGTNGRVYASVADRALWNFEITGLDSIRPLPGGKLSVRAPEP